MLFCSNVVIYFGRRCPYSFSLSDTPWEKPFFRLDFPLDSWTALFRASLTILNEKKGKKASTISKKKMIIDNSKKNQPNELVLSSLGYILTDNEKDIILFHVKLSTVWSLIWQLLCYLYKAYNFAWRFISWLRRNPEYIPRGHLKQLSVTDTRCIFEKNNRNYFNF